MSFYDNLYSKSSDLKKKNDNKISDMNEPTDIRYQRIMAECSVQKKGDFSHIVGAAAIDP